MSLQDEIPGYREALAAEQEARDFAFLSLPISICGVDVVPMTPRHFLILLAAESPFVCGGDIEATDVAVFLWVTSPGFSPGQSLVVRLKRHLFYRSIRNIRFTEAVKEIQSYINECFCDSPGSKSISKAPTVSFISLVVDALASAYGWPEDKILDIPWKRIYQYLRIQISRKDPKSIIFNRKSDKVKSDFLKEVNGEKNV